MTASPTGPPRFSRILVALDPVGGGPALAAAIAAATERTTLTLLACVPRPHPLVTLAGCSPAELLHEAERESADRLRAAAARVPAHVGVRTVLRHGVFDRVLGAEADTRHHDLIVVGSSGSGRLSGRLFGTRWGALARRSPTPVFIVPCVD